MRYDPDDYPEFVDGDDEEAEHGICRNCNGSGEGMHDGTLCYTCKGKGEC